MRRLSRLLLGLAGMAMLLDCGGGSSTGPNGGGGGGGGGGGSGSGSMTASLDGNAFSAGSGTALAIVGANRILTIQGTQAGTTIALALYNIDSLGTFLLGKGPSTVGGLGQVSTTTGSIWTSALSGAEGSVTISTLTASRIAGSFSFNADSSFGASHGSRMVTNGQFDLPLGGALDSVPDNAWGEWNGTVGGSTFEASTVLGTTPSGALSITSSNTDYSLGVVVIGFTGVGTYNLGLNSGEAGTTVLGPYTNPNGPVNCCWVSTTGSTGTLTITTMTATRIQGTLVGTLPPQAGSAASAPISVNTTFDIGLN